MTTRIVIRSFAAVAACVLFASGCNGETVVDPNPIVGDAPGNYVLQTVNDQLPFQFTHNDASGATTVDILSGTLALTASGTFREVLNYHIVPPSPQTPFDAPAVTDGTYSVDGANITFTYIPSGGAPYSWGGTLATGSVIYTDTGFADVPGGLTVSYLK